LVEPRLAQAGLAHTAETLVDRRLVDVTRAPFSEERGEPLPVQPPVVIDGLRLPAFLSCEMFDQEALHGLVEDEFRRLAADDCRLLVRLGHEGSEVSRRLAAGARLDAPVGAPPFAVVVRACLDGQLPRAGAHYTHGSAPLARPGPTVGGRRFAAHSHASSLKDAKMLNANARRDIGTREHACTVSERPVHELPRDLVRCDVLAVDLKPAGAGVRPRRAGPEVMLVRAVDERLKAVTECPCHPILLRSM
jgi:hypothetical protein